jgi:hypothetical protein
LRNELNTTRSRLLETEKDLLQSREQCIKLTEDINKLETEVCFDINFILFFFEIKLNLI